MEIDINGYYITLVENHISIYWDINGNKYYVNIITMRIIYIYVIYMYNTYGSKHCLRRYIYNPLVIIPLQSYFPRRYLAGSIGNNHPLARKDIVLTCFN